MEKCGKVLLLAKNFSTSILIGCNYVNNAAALTRCLILWKIVCSCRLPYPKAIKNNFSSLPIYMFRGNNTSLPHKYSCNVKPRSINIMFSGLENGDQLRPSSPCSLRPQRGGQVYSSLQNVGKIQKPIWLQRLSYDKVTVLVD